MLCQAQSDNGMIINIILQSEVHLIFFLIIIFTNHINKYNK